MERADDRLYTLPQPNGHRHVSSSSSSSPGISPVGVNGATNATALLLYYYHTYTTHRSHVYPLLRAVSENIIR